MAVRTALTARAETQRRRWYGCSEGSWRDYVRKWVSFSDEIPSGVGGPRALSERHQVLLGRRGGRDEAGGVLKGNTGVAALVLFVSLDVCPFMSMVDRDHVVADLAFELADGDGLPALRLAEVKAGTASGVSKTFRTLKKYSPIWGMIRSM